MNKVYIGIITVLSISLTISGLYISSLKDKYDVSVNNNKAYQSIIEDNNENIRALNLNIEQLEYFNDSIMGKMNEVRKELEIKDKNLLQMQYMLSEAKKKDTVIFRDTLFRESINRIDTVMGDKWYQCKLELSYPNTVIVSPKFISEKYVVVNYRKETVEPPKKCFIARWFQKRHKIVEVNVIEKNPYIENKQQRFIKIIK